MQWIVGHRPKLRLIVIYIGYWSAIDYLQWNVESTSKLDYKGVNIPMGPTNPHSKLTYYDDTIYEGLIDYRFILVHKGINYATLHKGIMYKVSGLC